MRYEVMATVRVLRATFLDTAGVDERGCLARRDLALHFHPGHLLKLHQLGLRTRRSASRCCSQYQGGGAAGDPHQEGIRNRTNAHVTASFSATTWMPAYCDAPQVIPQLHYCHDYNATGA